MEGGRRNHQQYDHRPIDKLRNNRRKREWQSRTSKQGILNNDERQNIKTRICDSVPKSSHRKKRKKNQRLKNEEFHLWGEEGGKKRKEKDKKRNLLNNQLQPAPLEPSPMLPAPPPRLPLRRAEGPVEPSLPPRS